MVAVKSADVPLLLGSAQSHLPTPWPWALGTAREVGAGWNPLDLAAGILGWPLDPEAESWGQRCLGCSTPAPGPSRLLRFTGTGRSSEGLPAVSGQGSWRWLPRALGS